MSQHHLITHQTQFMDFLLGKHSDIEQSIVDQGNISVQHRLNIYRNAYNIRLIETIDTDHEILGLYLGDEWFELMVKGYIKNQPSQSTSLRQYAEQLPHYLASTPPFDEHPILSEMAYFERLLLHAFDAGEAKRLTHQELSSTDPDTWPNMTFLFHPSVQIFHAHWNTVHSWQALKSGEVPDAATQQRNTWIIWRNNDRLTEFYSLESDESHIMSQALQGVPFAELCEILLTYHHANDVSQIAVDYLLKWINHGLLLSQISSPDKPHTL